MFANTYHIGTYKKSLTRSVTFRNQPERIEFIHVFTVADKFSYYRKLGSLVGFYFKFAFLRLLPKYARLPNIHCEYYTVNHSGCDRNCNNSQRIMLLEY